MKGDDRMAEEQAMNTGPEILVSRLKGLRQHLERVNGK